MSMIAVAATAQDMYDALTFSQSYYKGTARTIGMGNAMAAIGGDLGSIGINPAGGAVAGYSQITLTPGVTLATSSSQYTPVFGTNYTTKTSDAFSRANLPNIGFMINWSTGRSHGVKNWTFGMVPNITTRLLCLVHLLTTLLLMAFLQVSSMKTMLTLTPMLHGQTLQHTSLV